jgi:beta-galactosidase
MGIKVREYDPISESIQNEVGITGISLDRGVYKIEKWCDIIETQSAETAAAYSYDFYKGTPAVTVNSFGKGKTLYIGTMGKDGLERDLIRWAAAEAGIKCDFTAGEGIEVRPRTGENATYYFILNHSPSAARIAIPREMADEITGRKIAGIETIPPYGVLILKSPDQPKKRKRNS